MHKLIISVVFSLIATSAFAQQSVVEKYRNLYPTPLGAANAVQLLKDVAIEVKGGILKKPDGHNCLGYACDIICFADGNHVDVLVDAEGSAFPTWRVIGKIDPTRCELVEIKPPDHNPPDDPTDFPKPDTAQWDKLYEKMDNIIVILLEQNKSLVAAINELKKQIEGGIKVKF